MNVCQDDGSDDWIARGYRELAESETRSDVFSSHFAESSIGATGSFACPVRWRHGGTGAVPEQEKRGNGMGSRPPAGEMRQTSRRPSTSITIAGSRNRVEAAAATRPPSMLTANGTRNRSSSLRS